MNPFRALGYFKHRLLPGILGVSLLAGCASMSPDGGMTAVSELTQARIGEPVRRMGTDQEASEIAAEIDRLLATPLDMEAAVRVALLNNRDLQAEFSSLGIAEADLVQAGRLRNPSFSFSRLSGGGTKEIERGFLFDLMGLLTMPARTEIESRRFSLTQKRVAESALRLASETRKAYVSAIAARQSVSYMEDVQVAAEAGAELASRMADAGNFSRLRQQREQLYLAGVKAQLTRARQIQTDEEERLTRLLGFESSQRYRLLPRLPSPPDTPMEEGPLLQRAMDQRLDLMIARQELDALAKNLGLSRTTRFINVLEAGYLNSDATGEPDKRGYEIELSLPLFDWGQARTAKAEALYTQAMNRVAGLAVRARSEVRESYATYRSAHQLMQHHWDEVVPLRKRMSEETLLRYNGMLISVWELLADSREQSASVNAAIQSLKDFWIADATLRMTLEGGSAGSKNMTENLALPVSGSGGH